MDQTISKTESAILHTYNRYDLVLEKGDGAYLYDTDGKAYLDFGSGIGVSSLGYGNKTLQSALKKQIDQLIHTSNLYYHEPLAQAAEKLKTISGMDRVFFANSGTEAIESIFLMEESRIVCCLKFLQTEELELPFLREKGANFTMDQTISKTESAILHTYNRYDLVLEKGDGAYLYDTDGKAYLDFGSGIGVSSLGYGNKTLQSALKKQIDQLIHTSNLYYHEPLAQAAEKLKTISGMDRVFFANSGTEAIEGALKTARKYAKQKGNSACEIISMEHSFHGRSMGALSVTGTESYREPFEPLVGGVKFAIFNDLESVKEQVTEKTGAILLEPVQGEGGVFVAEQSFLQGLRTLCEEKGILLIFDEIQCGMGRTGSMFAWQGYGVQPDILVMAKAIGNGVPVGAFAMKEEVAQNSLKPGDHGTTYGGNPLACQAVSTVIDLFTEQKLAEHVRRLTPYLEEKLDTLLAKYDLFTGRRGKGFMQGLITSCPAGKIVEAAKQEGLLLVTAGAQVVRFLPPLIITEKEIDEMTEKLERALVRVC